MLLRLHERRESHLQRGRAYRIGFATAGFLVLVGGIVLSLPLVPGPGFVLIAIGLGMLALEFLWAERLLAAAVDRLERVTNRMRRSERAAGPPETGDDAPDERRREAV
ncbi:MAG: PGPGW domain-containing protein [Actinobacteria bacterium]|nr:PGPGW domain-containing protein [Actinomycetota bacterium]